MAGFSFVYKSTNIFVKPTAWVLCAPLFCIPLILTQILTQFSDPAQRIKNSKRDQEFQNSSAISTNGIISLLFSKSHVIEA